MTQLSRLVSGVDRYLSPAQRALASRSEAQRRSAESATSDMDLVSLTRTNLFIVADDDVVARLVTSLWPSLAPPIFVRQRGEPLRLSLPSQPVRTIVVYDVDTLSRREQSELYELMGSGNGRIQVVSTASKSLRPLLEAGAFNEALYYRLNVVTLDLTS